MVEKASEQKERQRKLDKRKETAAERLATKRHINKMTSHSTGETAIMRTDIEEALSLLLHLQLEVLVARRRHLVGKERVAVKAGEPVRRGRRAERRGRG